MASTRAWGGAVAAVIVVTVALAGCVPSAPVASQTPTPEPTITNPGQSSTNAPDPVLRPDGSAAANQQYFDMVNSSFYATYGRSDGRSIIDNLVAAGFQKQDMEVTPDRTSIDLVADSIIFSVRINGECLVGQFNATNYRGIIAPLLATGGCLIGRTRPIDW